MQIEAIVKAVNNIENAVKEKHIRNILLLLEFSVTVFLCLSLMCKYFAVLYLQFIMPRVCDKCSLFLDTVMPYPIILLNIT